MAKNKGETMIPKFDNDILCKLNLVISDFGHTMFLEGKSSWAVSPLFLGFLKKRGRERES